MNPSSSECSMNLSSSHIHTCIHAGMRLVRGIAISSDGMLLCACDSDGHVTLWDISLDNQYSFPSYIEACSRSRARSSCWGCIFGSGVLARVALVHCEDSHVVPVSVDMNNMLSSGQIQTHIQTQTQTQDKCSRGDSDVNLSHSYSSGMYELSDGPGQLPVFDQTAEFEALIDDECGWCNVMPLRIDGTSCLCMLEEPLGTTANPNSSSSGDINRPREKNVWVDVLGVRYRSAPVSEEEVLEEGENVLVCIPCGDRDVYFDAEVVDFVPGGGLQVKICIHTYLHACMHACMHA
jgi:hypothetical protein